MGAAMRPDYFNENVNYAALLAPIVHMGNIEVESLKTLAEPQYLDPAIKYAVGYLHFWNIDTKTKANAYLFHLFCEAFGEICNDMSATFVLNPDVDNVSRTDEMVSFFPAGYSWRNFAHYAQIVNS